MIPGHDPVRCLSAAPNGSAHGSGSVKTAGQVDPCNPCNEGSHTLLQPPPSMPASCLAASAALLPALPSNKRGERRFELVGHSPNFMEREVHHSRQSRANDRDGCLQHRLGARCGSLQTGGPWSPTEARMHINCLELLAATLATQAFAKKQENILVHLKLDSTSALTYINKMGGTVSPNLNRLTKNLWT